MAKPRAAWRTFREVMITQRMRQETDVAVSALAWRGVWEPPANPMLLDDCVRSQVHIFCQMHVRILEVVRAIAISSRSAYAAAMPDMDPLWNCHRLVLNCVGMLPCLVCLEDDFWDAWDFLPIKKKLPML